ncbi:MAG: hypothetical protein IKZ20_07455 [Bacteroidaceae bacterium]|nr:hypothetical protein [Bacteroidaceae bacterium]
MSENADKKGKYQQGNLLLFMTKGVFGENSQLIALAQDRMRLGMKRKSRLFLCPALAFHYLCFELLRWALQGMNKG